MKIRPALNLCQIVYGLLLILSGSIPVSAGPSTPPAITNVDFPAIGTPEKLEAFAVKTVNRIFTFAWAYKTNGQLVGFATSTWYGSFGQSPYIYGPFTNKTQLDQQCVSNIDIFLSMLITNTDPSIDKSQGLTIYVPCKAYSGLPSLNTFYSYYTRYHLAESNGTYSLPNLSGFSTQLNSDIPLYIPDLQWARYEIGFIGDDYPSIVDDNLYEPPGPIDSEGFLDLPTGYMSDSSSTNGDLWIKVSAFAKGGFYIWDGDGTQVTETPFKLQMNLNNTNVTVRVSGGDSGRGFMLQSSTDLAAWTNCSPTKFVPTNAQPNLVPTLFAYPFTNGSVFFRTATTNVSPM